MMFPNQPQPESRKGFTLLELILVLVILVVLASVTVRVFSNTRKSSMIRIAKTEVGNIRTAIDQYEIEMGQYPSNLEELVKKPSGDDGSMWSGPYIEQVKKDPWNNDYRLKAPGTHNTDTFDLWSVGPDGQEGTDDDIGNWNL